MVILGYLWTGIVFVTMISLLVAAHELGHYLFARLFNMGCEEFAIGFGKPILAVWKRKTYKIPLEPGQDPMLHKASEASALEGGNKVVERTLVDDGTAIEETTDFTIRPWPIGGFVRIKGMMPEEDGSETRIPGGFYSKAPWKRLIVLFAGPAFSVLAGIALLIPVYMFAGFDKPVNEPVLGQIVPTGPAARAGLKPGDRVVAIDGQPVQTFYDVLSTVRSSAGKQLTFLVDRKGREFKAKLTPNIDPDPTPVFDRNLEVTTDLKRQGKMAAAWQYRNEKLSFGQALSEAMKQPVMVVKGVASLFRKPANFGEQVSGPASMVKLTNDAVKLGLDRVLWLAALLSISVGIMNLLPIPPLDGGQMLVALAELLRGGRRLSMRMQNFANLVGVAMVFALMIGAVAVDVKRFVDAPKKEAALKKQLEGK